MPSPSWQIAAEPPAKSLDQEWAQQQAQTNTWGSEPTAGKLSRQKSTWKHKMMRILYHDIQQKESPFF